MVCLEESTLGARRGIRGDTWGVTKIWPALFQTKNCSVIGRHLTAPTPSLDFGALPSRHVGWRILFHCITSSSSGARSALPPQMIP